MTTDPDTHQPGPDAGDLDDEARARRPHRVSHLSFRGEGRAHPEDAPEARPTRVPKTVPGDRVTLTRAVDHRGRLVWRLDRLLTPGPDRVDPGCAQDARCPGCQLRALAPAARRAQRRDAWQRALARLAGVPPERVAPVTPAPLVDGYRARATARLVRDPTGQVRAAMWPLAGAGPAPIDLTRCPAQTAGARAILSSLVDALRAAALPVTGDPASAASGRLHHALVEAVDAPDDAAPGGRLVLLSDAPAEAALRPVAEALRARHPTLCVLSGVVADGTSRLDARALTPLAGDPTLRLDVGPWRLRASPGAWISAAPEHAALVRRALLARVDRLLADAPGADAIVEIGCGVGTHSLDLAQRAARFVGVDLSREAIADAAANALTHGLLPPAVTFRVGRGDRALRRLISGGLRARLLILHGMRRPLGERLCRVAPALGAQAIIYVTPTAWALGADLPLLRDAGFDLERIEPLDTMPGTYHMMALAILRRAP